MQNLIITLVFEKNAKYFAENWGKSQKIVIITSTLACRNSPLKDKISLSRLIYERFGENTFVAF
jgi:hypothetical protein